MSPVENALSPWCIGIRKLATHPAIAVSLLLISVVFMWPASGEPTHLPDSYTYINWWKARPFTYPLFLKLFGHGWLLSLVQTLLSISAWAFLGWVLCRTIGMAICLIPACSLQVAQYNLVVLSDSLSFSLFALCLALVLLLYRSWRWPLFAAFLVSAILFGYCRAPNFFVLPIFALPFLFRNRRHAALVFVCGTLLLLSYTLNKSPKNKEYAIKGMVHNFLYRVIPDPDGRAYFEARGMPLSEGVLSYCTPEPAMEVIDGARKHEAYQVGHENPEFRDWFKEHAHEYKRWIITRPKSYWMVFPALQYFKNRHVLYSRDQTFRGLILRVDSRYVLWGKLPVWLWVLCIGIPIMEFVRKRQLSQLSMAILLFMSVTYVFTFINFHGHAGAVHRYLVPSGILYRLTLACAALALLKPLYDNYVPEPESEPEDA